MQCLLLHVCTAVSEPNNIPILPSRRPGALPAPSWFLGSHAPFFSSSSPPSFFLLLLLLLQQTARPGEEEKECCRLCLLLLSCCDDDGGGSLLNMRVVGGWLRQKRCAQTHARTAQIKGRGSPRTTSGLGEHPAFYDTAVRTNCTTVHAWAYSIYFFSSFFFFSSHPSPPPPTTNSAAREGGEGVLSALSSSSVVL